MNEASQQADVCLPGWFINLSVAAAGPLKRKTIIPQRRRQLNNSAEAAQPPSKP
jgi:hypothetical protein